eukprot:Gb_37987 [translate_table: standard]
MTSGRDVDAKRMPREVIDRMACWELKEVAYQLGSLWGGCQGNFKSEPKCLELRDNSVGNQWLKMTLWRNREFAAIDQEEFELDNNLNHCSGNSKSHDNIVNKAGVKLFDNSGNRTSSVGLDILCTWEAVDLNLAVEWNNPMLMVHNT